MLVLLPGFRAPYTPSLNFLALRMITEHLHDKDKKSWKK